MSICFVGNSHLVALKEAEGALRAKPGSVKWLYAPGRALGSLQVVDGILRSEDPMTIERLKARNDEIFVDVSEPEAFVVVGLGVSPQVAFEILESCAPYPYGGDSRVLASRSLLEAAVRARLGDVTGLRVAKLIADHTSAPVILVPQPAPLELLKTWRRPESRRGREPREKISARFDRHEEVARLFSGVVSSGLGDTATSIFNNAVEDLCRVSGLHFVAQPDLTLANGLTKERYERVHQTRPVDLIHANREYGSHVLNALMIQLRKVGAPLPLT